MLTWNLQVQQVISLCGLPISAGILGDSKSVAEGSHAANLGHKTIEELVSKSEEENGLGASWADFRDKMRAAVYQQQFSISELNYQDIIAQVDSVHSLLGYMPNDAYEFHSAREKSLSAEIEQLKRDMAIAKQDHKEKLREMMVQISDEVEKVNAAKAHAESLTKSHNLAMKAASEEAAGQVAAVEAKGREALEAARIQAQAEYESKLGKISAELTEKIGLAESHKAEAQAQLAAIEARIESGDLVSKDTVDEIQARLASSLLDVTQAKGETDELREELEKAELSKRLSAETIIKQKDDIAELQGHIEALNGQVREVLQDKASSPVYAVLTERVEHWKEMYNESRAELDDVKSKLTESEVSVKLMKGRYTALKEDGKRYTTKLEASKKMMAVSKGLMEEIIARQKRVIFALGVALSISVVGFFVQYL